MQMNDPYFISTVEFYSISLENTLTRELTKNIIILQFKKKYKRKKIMHSTPMVFKVDRICYHELHLAKKNCTPETFNGRCFPLRYPLPTSPAPKLNPFARPWPCAVCFLYIISAVTAARQRYFF